MMHARFASVALPAGLVGASAGTVSNRQFRQSLHNNTQPTRQSCGENQMHSNGSSKTSLVGFRRKDTRISDAKDANQDWLASRISRYSIHEVVKATGMSETAVQNIRRGKAKLSYDNLKSLCHAKPDFAADFAVEIGLLLPSEAETTALVTQLVQAHARRGG